MSRARYATDAAVAAAVAFVPPAAGGVTVTSTAATDLDDVSAALVEVKTELAALRTKLGF